MYVSKCVHMCMCMWICSCVYLYVLRMCAHVCGYARVSVCEIMYAHVSVCMGGAGTVCRRERMAHRGGAQRARPAVGDKTEP